MVTYRVLSGTFTGDSVTELTGNNVLLQMIAQQQPESAKELRKKFGVCVHPNFDNTVWEHNAEWTADIAACGFENIRGMIATNMPLVREALLNAKQNGLKWFGQVAAIKQKTTNAQIDARLDYIKNNIEDFACVEGPNEPDRDGLTQAEVDRTVEIMKRIYKWKLDNNIQIPVASPALRMPASREMYQRFVDAGIVGTFDVVSLHHYFGDKSTNTAELSAHCDAVEDVWKCSRFWISETGRTTALNSVNQRPPVSELAQSKLVVRDMLDCLEEKRVEKVFLYEWLDDPNAAKDDTEKNYGCGMKVQTTEPDTWTPKLSFNPLQEFLSTLIDNEPQIGIDPIDLEITKPDGVLHRLVSKSHGQVTLWLWRPDATVWWPETDRDVDPAPVDVVVYSKYGEHTVQVGGQAVGLVLN